jgi:ABC-type transport system involved in cytochrome c biogenesis permease subunit
MSNSWQKGRMMQMKRKQSVPVVAGNTKLKTLLTPVSSVVSRWRKRKKESLTSEKTRHAILIVAVFDAMLIITALSYDSILSTILFFTAGFILGYIWG